jgi:hypothetical protein
VADFIDKPKKTGFIDSGALFAEAYDRATNYDAIAVAQQDETPAMVKTRINTEASQTYLKTIATAIDAKEDPAVVADKINDGEKKLLGKYSADDVYIEDSVLAKSPGYSAAENLYYRNLQIMTEEIESAGVKQEDRSWLGLGVDFVDREVIRASLFGWWESANNRTATEGAEIATKLFTENDPREVRRYMREKVESANAEGVLVGNNYFAYNEMVRRAYSLGYNPDLTTDRVFAAIDFTGIVGGVAKLGKFAKLSKAASLKSTTAATRAGALGGVEEANAVAKNLHLREIDPTNTANIQAAAVDLNKGVARPSTGFVQRMMAENKIAQKIMPTLKGAVPDAESLLKFDNVKAKAAEAFSKATKTIVYKTDIIKTPDNVTAIEFSLGKNEGIPFKTTKKGNIESGAQKLADKVGGTVVPVSPEDLSLGYVVKVQEAADTLQGVGGKLDISLAKNMWNKTIGAILDNPLVGSTVSRGPSELNALGLRSEAGKKYILNAASKAERTISKLNATEYSTLDNILKDLTDGPDSTLRKGWDELEFSSRWKAETGSNPSPKVMAAFHAAEDTSDMAYYLHAMRSLQDAVAKGFKNSVEAEAGVFIPARRIRLQELADGTKIFDGAGRGKLIKEDFKEFGNDFNVWELDSPWNGQTHIAFPNSTKVIGPRDVLGYSAYGRRTNPLIRYFTYLRDENGFVKSILGSISAKESELAKKQLKAIQDAYKTGDADAIDEAIQANNDWDKSINTKAGMDKFLEDHKIDIYRGEINSRLRDGPYTNPNDKFYDGDSIGDTIERQNSRASIPLAQYGGGGAYNPNPIDSIISQYGTEAHNYAFSLYTQRSMQGWIDTAEDLMANNLNVVVRFPKAQSVRHRFMGATVEGTGPEAARMREVQDQIMRQANIKNDVQRTRETFVDSMSEAFYDQTGISVDIKGVPGKLLSLGFFSAFSFNLSHMFLQGSQVANIIAIAGKNGLKGTVHAGHLRKILFGAEDVAVESLGLEQLAKSMELEVSKVEEITQLFRETLPNIVNGDIMEHGSNASMGMSTDGTLGKALYGAKKFAKAAMNFGLIPFNLGESTAKSSAFMTAALEFVERNPALSVLSESGRNYIASRTSTLTQNMNAVSKAKLQTGLMAVPSQWLNYFFRTSEQVFIGRDLTIAERSRLGLMVMPFYGFTGLGMAGATDAVAEWMGLDPTSDADKATYITLKYGLLDGFLNYYTPFDVALSERMAPAPAVWDLYDKFTEESVMSALGGPSGSIAFDFGAGMFNLVSNVSNGYTSTLNEDILRVLRNFSGINNTAKAVGIMMDGVYRSKKGLALPLEMDETDAIISATGFTPIEVTELYYRIGQSIDLSEDFKAVRNMALDRSKLAWEVYAEDPERAARLLTEAQLIISKSPFSTSKKHELTKSISRPSGATYVPTMRNLVELGKNDAAQWVKSFSDNGNQ